MEVREPVIVDVVRTAFGKRNGALRNWHPTDLLGFALKGLVERTGVDPEIVDDVVGGCITQSGEQGCNVTRNGWVAAGLPWHVPATTVDRQCGSSQQAMHFVAASVMAGLYDVAIACGVESMSRAPMASNAKGGTGPFSQDFLRVVDGKLWAQFQVAQVLADKWKITRDGRASRAADPGSLRAVRRWRRGPGAGAVGAQPGDAQAAGALGHDHRRLRCDGVQRGLRRHRADVGPRVPARSREVQPQRRGH